jgi:hypothetical protein
VLCCVVLSMMDVDAVTDADTGSIVLYILVGSYVSWISSIIVIVNFD